MIPWDPKDGAQAVFSILPFKGKNLDRGGCILHIPTGACPWLQQCDVIGFAETRRDSSHNCSAIAHGLRLLGEDPLQLLQKIVLNAQSFAIAWATGGSGAYGLGSEGSSVRKTLVASFIGLPSQKELEPGEGKIAVFQYLQRGYQEKTGIGSTQ